MRKRDLLTTSALCAVLATVMAPVAAAQEAAVQDEAVAEVVVTGSRATQRTSIELKRSSAVIVDGIVNEEIGALPDNSVADTLERVTGVTADRFKGNANELSVRGLGPTLSFSTFNGREVSTAGPDRSVAFQQFPSELVNGVLVYKSQQADFVEGGIAGVIELRSIKPLESRRRLQMEVRGVYQEKDDAVQGRNGLGYRANISYTNKFETELGDIGLSIGYQHQDQASPEDYYTTNSSFIPCNTSAINPSVITGSAAAQAAAGTNVNCRNLTAATTGVTLSPLYFATTSRAFQHRVTSEVRDGVIGAVQWRPNDRLDISLDGQYSNRSSLEDRNMLAITEAARGIRPEIIGGEAGNDFSDGALVRYTGNSNVEIQLENRLREEEYIGGGAAFAWHGDKLHVTGDLSYSESHRTELQKATNMRSVRRAVYTLDATTDVVPSITFDNFDVTDYANFGLATPANNTNYARYRLTTDRKDEIAAVRGDATYDLGGSLFKSIKFGARLSEHTRVTDTNNNSDVNLPIARDGLTTGQIVAQARANCQVPFKSDSFMKESTTNVKTWALFDNDCLFRAYTGRDTNPLLADSRGPEDTNVTEKIGALYVMTNFASEWNSVPFSGNAGVRYVTTKVDASGYRSEVLVTPSVGGSDATLVVVPGTLSEITGSGEYDYFLPSLNLTFDLNDITKLRFGVYRALSRVGIEEFNVGITPVVDANATTVEGVLANSTTGNPTLKPLVSWNLDTSLEFYVNPDTAFSVTAYYKELEGAAFDAVQPFTTEIIANGVPVTFNAIAPANDAEKRHLYGFEVTASHAFTYLPAPFDGFGVNGGYNYADADFEFPDPSTVAPYVEPANLRGLSKHNANASIYWEKSGVQLRASYRYRSDYSKPNSGTNRSVDGSGYLNLSASYDLTPNLQLKVQALNVTNTRDIMYKPGEDSITEVSESSPQYYFGIRARF